MNIYIIRNNQRFGPYQEHMLLSYVNQGVVLKQDKAIIDGESQEQTVEYYLKKHLIGMLERFQIYLM